MNLKLTLFTPVLQGQRLCGKKVILMGSSILALHAQIG